MVPCTIWFHVHLNTGRAWLRELLYEPLLHPLTLLELWGRQSGSWTGHHILLHSQVKSMHKNVHPIMSIDIFANKNMFLLCILIPSKNLFLPDLKLRNPSPVLIFILLPEIPFPNSFPVGTSTRASTLDSPTSTSSSTVRTRLGRGRQSRGSVGR